MNYKGIKDKKYHCEYCGNEIPWKGHSYNHKYCNNACQGKYKSESRIKRDRPLFLKGQLKSRAAIKPFVVERDGYKCSICNQEPVHNGKPLTMILDHIDGNATNNDPSNLRLVCPNCDTQLPTYKSKNIGNGRAKHGLVWYSAL
jgi:hypothetical protein